jgi:hypothetical protein
MSEFKFACPVCGQHMACDSSQSGTVMECPTCFQKITAPQAPAMDDPKFIITGTKVGERPPPKFPEANPYALPPVKTFPGALAVVVILIFIGAVVAFVYRGTIFKSKNLPEESNPSSAKIHLPPKPTIVAPPASDTNWMLALGTNAISDVPAAGRIHGQDFIVERAVLYNGTLILRDSGHGSVTFGVTINFSGALPEALSGQTINVMTNAAAAAHVTLHWLDGLESVKAGFDSGYALRLEFGALANNRLPGKIYLCLPDAEKSYLLGSFNAEARKPRPRQ